MNENFIKIEVYRCVEEQKKDDVFNLPLSNEVKYILKRHNEPPLATKLLSLFECSRIIHPKKDT